MSEGNLYAERVYQPTSKDAGQLEKNVQDHPFSPLANFLLLYHYKKTNHPSFEKLARKTVLHFPNPYWLQLLLHNQSPRHTNEASINHLPVHNISEKVTAENLPSEDNAGNDAPTGNAIKKRDALKHDHIKLAAPDIVTDSSKTKLQQLKNDTGEPAAPSAARKENTQVTEDTIAFDPLHTVDYFASQGIRLNEEEIPTNDKLASQMKSFTAWLKSMKRLHPAKLDEQTTATEKFVQAAAEESNVNSDVLTEAMAEVLIKQNKKEKAIDMYSKLSLINPAKSAYFAAKIESIKQL